MKTSVKWTSTASTVDIQRQPETSGCRRRPVENVSGRLRPVEKHQDGRRQPVEKRQDCRHRPVEQLSLVKLRLSSCSSDQT